VQRVKNTQELMGLMAASDKTKVGGGGACRLLVLLFGFTPLRCASHRQAAHHAHDQVATRSGLQTYAPNLSPTCSVPPPSPHAQVVLVTDKPRTAPMTKSLAQRFAGEDLLFVEVVRDGSTQALLETYGVDKAPMLVALPAGQGADRKLVYEGE